MKGIVGIIVVSSLVVVDAVSMAPRAWSSYGTSKTSMSAQSDGLGIDLPQWPNWLGYVWTGLNGPISNSVHVALRVEQSPGVSFRWDTEAWNTCYGTPAQVRPFIATWGRGKKDISFANRWWSNQVSFVLGGSAWEADIPLDPAIWSNEGGQFGTDVPARWGSDLAGVDAIGVSLGGGCFFGHGVGVENGTARIVLTVLEAS